MILFTDKSSSFENSVPAISLDIIFYRGKIHIMSGQTRLCALEFTDAKVWIFLINDSK